MITKLDSNARAAALEILSDWQFLPDRDAIIREITFADFRTAFAFMTEISLLAEKMDHHPEWFNVYNRLRILLTTHDCGGLSERDIAMARYIDDALRRWAPASR